MDVKICKSMWGMTEGVDLDDRLRLIRQAGYDGVETDPPDVDPQHWRDLCARHELTYVADIYPFTAGEFAEQLQRAVRYGPVLVNCHSGRDKMGFAAGTTYFQQALKVEADLGVPVVHETHRHRLLYAPWTTAAYLERFADLKINADFSHWVVVCESLLGDLESIMTLACTRAWHIHGRVGYEESPQLSDPRAPEYAHYVARFEEWWDAIHAARQAAGAPWLTFTPEYGPPGYMPSQPYTRQPLANLWEVCLWAAQRQRARWRR